MVLCTSSRAGRQRVSGHTLLKRRHLELLGNALVTVPYWEWEGCKGAGEREQYLRGKLARVVQAGHERTNSNFASGGARRRKWTSRMRLLR